jgi:sec-independent protein translocase protein TatB
MFDVGFFELMLIGIVLLLVVGPERLPKVARTAGLWLGKARSMVASVKADIDRELAADELKKALQKQAQLPGLHDILEETREAVDEIEQVKTDYQVKAIPDTPQARIDESSPAKTSDDDQAR